MDAMDSGRRATNRSQSVELPRRCHLPCILMKLHEFRSRASELWARASDWLIHVSEWRRHSELPLGHRMLHRRCRTCVTLACFFLLTETACLDDIGAEAGDSTDATRWFCSHGMPWEVCKQFVPSERTALKSFMIHLEKTGVPGPEDLDGRGIVMSGGPMHVMQALSNLYVLRTVYKSQLPVEFWHAYELKDFHCEALASVGATCKVLQVPGVYPLWQTTMPAIMSSSFREVLWLDTDITPLIDPAVLFETEAYKREGALFWPDLWGSGCPEFGQSSWRQHIVRHLLDFPYNESDPSCTHEHEAGHLLLDKVRHWRPICLANYLASRDFFAQVLHGYKDVFRLAWLKLQASGWLSPLRPGLVGGFVTNGQFITGSLVHFWPAGDEPVFGAPKERVAIYVHQKKNPGTLWQDIITFPEPLGACTKYRMGFVRVEDLGAHWWNLAVNHQELSESLSINEQLWNRAYNHSYSMFENDPRPTEADLKRLHRPGQSETTQAIKQQWAACSCDYTDNRWLALLTGLVSKSLSVELLGCDEVLGLGLNPSACPVGYAVAALVCSQMLLKSLDLPSSRSAAGAVARLLPQIEKCLPHSFWPVTLEDLRSFVTNTSESGEVEDFLWKAEHRLPVEVLKRFPREYRRCVPFKDPQCWQNTKAMAESQGLDWANYPHQVCLYCCDPNFRTTAWQVDESIAEALSGCVLSLLG